MKHHLTPLDATQLDSWRALAAHRQELQDFRMRLDDTMERIGGIFDMIRIQI